MGMFKTGSDKRGQGLRSIAEHRGAPGNFPEELPFDPRTGLTGADKGFAQQHKDPAEAARPQPSTGRRGGGPKPYKG